MAVINVPGKPGFFDAMAAGVDQGAQRAQEVMLQEKELAIRKEDQKLRQQQFELDQAQQQRQFEMDLTLRQQVADLQDRIGAANIGQTIAQTGLINAQTEQTGLQTEQLRTSFDIDQEVKQSQINLANAQAAGIPLEIAIAQENLKLRQQDLEDTRELEIGRAHRAQEVAIMEMSTAMGVNPMIIESMMGIPANANERFQQTRALMSGAESLEGFQEASLDQRLRSVMLNLGLGPEAMVGVQQELQEGNSLQDIMIGIVQMKDRDFAGGRDEKYQKIFALQLLDPTLTTIIQEEDPGQVRFRDSFNWGNFKEWAKQWNERRLERLEAQLEAQRNQRR